MFCALLALIMFRQMKSSERTFSNKNASLTRERAELKVQFDSLSEVLDKSRVTITSLERERRSIEEEFARLQKENGELKNQSTKTLYMLKRENKAMRKRIDVFRKCSTAELIKQLASRESDSGIKNILSDTLVKIEAAKDGKYVQLDPIVVGAAAGDGARGASNTKQNKVISVNKKNNLVVINAGRSQGLAEGKRCHIVGDHGEIAAGMIIRTRYEISAIFVDTFSDKYTINDIKEGDGVAVD